MLDIPCTSSHTYMQVRTYSTRRNITPSSEPPHLRLGSSCRGEPAGKYLPEGDLGGIEVVEVPRGRRLVLRLNQWTEHGHEHCRLSRKNLVPTPRQSGAPGYLAGSPAGISRISLRDPPVQVQILIIIRDNSYCRSVKVSLDKVAKTSSAATRP